MTDMDLLDTPTGGLHVLHALVANAPAMLLEAYDSERVVDAHLINLTNTSTADAVDLWQAFVGRNEGHTIRVTRAEP